MDETGRPRDPALVFILVFLTYGIYWFVWVYRSFAEVARNERRDLRARPWVTALVLSFVPLVALTLVDAATIFSRIISSRPVTLDSVTTALVEPTLSNEPWAALLPIPFLVLQFAYLERATRLVRDAARKDGDPHAPHPVLVAAFSGLGLLELVPTWGWLFLLAGLVVWAVWKFQTQRAINRYWARRRTPTASHGT